VLVLARGVIEAGEQAGAFGAGPGQLLPGVRQPRGGRRSCRRCNRGRGGGGAGLAGQEGVGAGGGLGVVVQQPPHRLSGVIGTKVGLALPADRWTEEAARLLAAAGYDATLADAAAGAEVAARLLFSGITAATKAAVRKPRTAIMVMAAAGLVGWYCHRRGWITGADLRSAGRKAAAVARPIAARVAAADARRNEARAALTVVEALERPSLEERCARDLARRRTVITPAELAAILSLSGPAVTAAEVGAALATHPAFTGAEEGFILGRPATVAAITSHPARAPLGRG
jgi:hypothetical protein